MSCNFVFVDRSSHQFKQKESLFRLLRKLLKFATGIYIYIYIHTYTHVHMENTYRKENLYSTTFYVCIYVCVSACSHACGFSPSTWLETDPACVGMVTQVQRCVQDQHQVFHHQTHS
jgi:hypothetical protein